jgi:diguanylate cyclase (GGDEF)-like protein
MTLVRAVRSAWGWFRARAAYLLALLPVLTDWIDSGHWPQHLHELATEVVIGLLVLVGVWLLYRRGDRFKQLAETDALTGLGNRLRFRADLADAIARAHQSGRRLALAFIDVDDFKLINDRFGHLAGDDVLREVGTVLQRSVRDGVDGCYRLGGDEFAVLVSTVDARTAIAALNRAFARASATLTDVQMSCSVGVITLGASDGPAEFVRRADELMYAAKRGAFVESSPDAAFGKLKSGGPRRLSSALLLPF